MQYETLDTSLIGHIETVQKCQNRAKPEKPENSGFWTIFEGSEVMNLEVWDTSGGVPRPQTSRYGCTGYTLIYKGPGHLTALQQA